MNSKECLNKILDLLNYEQVNECEKNNYLKTIKQDLELLEILKKHIIIKKLYDNEYLELCLPSNNEYFKKIKEWLYE